MTEMRYILKKNCRDDFVDEVFTMMDDEVTGDGPETSHRAMRPTGADNFNQHHVDYENRIPQEPDQVQAAVNHNKAHPLMINELNKKKSLADAGMKKHQRDRDCNYDPTCRACRALMFWKELPKVAFDPKCRACRKLKAWRDSKRVNLKPPCKLAGRTKPKQNGRLLKSRNNKKMKKLSEKDRNRTRNVLAINDSKVEMVDDSRCCKKPKKRERECDSCSTDTCHNTKKKRKSGKKDSENSSKASLASDHKSRNDDSKSSYQDYGELDDEPMV